jgi:hypothetical protein
MEPILSFGVNPRDRSNFLGRENFTAPYAAFAIWRAAYTEARQIKVPRQVSRVKILSNPLAVFDAIDRGAFQRLISQA